jgi:hypothetical protein
MLHEKCYVAILCNRRLLLYGCDPRQSRSDTIAEDVLSLEFQVQFVLATVLIVCKTPKV